MKHDNGSGNNHTYCGLEINATLFFLSECNIWWFLVEPDSKIKQT